MDLIQFDAMSRTLSRLPSRRDVLRGLASAGLGLGALWHSVRAEGKKKGSKKKRKKKTIPAATCTPRCGRKQCGSDGCGGSCGTCSTGQFCASGTCCTPEPVDVTCTVDCGHGGACGQRC